MNEAQGNVTSFAANKAKIIQPILLCLLQKDSIWHNPQLQPAVELLLKDSYRSETIFDLSFLEESLHWMILRQFDDSMIELLAKKLALIPQHNTLLPCNNYSIWDTCLRSSMLGSDQLAGLALYLKNCNHAQNKLYSLLFAANEDSIAEQLAVLLTDKRMHTALRTSVDYNNIFLWIAKNPLLLQKLNAGPLCFYQILQRKRELEKPTPGGFVTDAEIKDLCLYAVTNFKNPNFIIFVLREILPYFNGAYPDLIAAVTSTALNMVGNTFTNELVTYLEKSSTSYLCNIAAMFGMGDYNSWLLSKILMAQRQIEINSKVTILKFSSAASAKVGNDQDVSQQHKDRGALKY
jgi:hypothetical protein